MTINCIRCGEKMDYEQRCCLKCGALNPNNDENKEFLNNNPMQDETLYLEDEYVSKLDFSSLELFSTEQKIGFYIVNIIAGFFPIILFLISIFINKSYLFKNSIEIYSNLIIPLLILLPFCIIFMFYNICLEKIFLKAEIGWWVVFVPIYREYMTFKMCFGDAKKFNFLIINWIVMLIISFISKTLTVPFLGIIILIYMLFILIYAFVVSIELIYFFSKRFKVSFILTFLFPFIMIPIIAFNKKIYYF